MLSFSSVRPLCSSNMRVELTASCRTAAVKSLQLLLDAASESKADTDQIKVPMALLGAALNHLMDAGAMSFTELLRLGQALAECSLPSKAEPLTISFAESLQVDAEFSHAIRGFRSLLSPEMPLSLKQVRCSRNRTTLDFTNDVMSSLVFGLLRSR